MSGDDATLKIGADGSQAEAELNKVAGAAEKAGQRIAQTMREASYNMASSTKAATEQMSGGFSKVTEAFGKVNAVMIGFAAIVAGGAVFKAAVEETVKLTMEAYKLSRQFGITATEAGVLSVALDNAYISNDTMAAANQKLTKTLGSNELAFKNLGVATRDTNGNFRSSLDIMLDVNGKLLQFKEGTDRNIEGQKIYGKSWGEVQDILRITTASMDEARKKSEELGLIVGKENVAAAWAYKGAMNDVGDVLTALKKAIGDALLPILTDLGNWFASIGPEAVMVMKAAIGSVAAAFYGLKMAVEIVYEIIRTFVRTTVISLMTFADAANKALHFDFAGAKAAWRAGGAAITDELGQSLDRITAKAEANRDRLVGLFAKPIATTKIEGGAHSIGSDADAAKEDKEAQKLAEMQIDRARDHQVALIGMERDQLALKKNLGQVSDQEEIAQLKTMKEREYQIEAQAIKDKIALQKTEGVEKQKELDVLAKLQDKHNAEMAQLDIKSTEAIKAKWMSALSAIDGAFSTSIQGMILGTQTLRQAEANIGKAILAEFVGMAVKRTTVWISNEAAMLFSSKAKNAAVTAGDVGASALAITSKETEATAVVSGDAAEGAAGAAASQAAIPVIGPGLAIAAFAATLAMILGARSLIKSSAGGEWQVPTDRLNLVHKDETILPAHIAGPLRAMFANGGTGGGLPPITIHAMDSRDVQRALLQGGALHKALTTLNRNFAKV